MKNNLISRRGKISAHVQFPHLTLDVESADPIASLRELTKIMHSIHALESQQFLMDEELAYRYGMLSEDLRNNQEGMSFIKAALTIEEEFKHRRVTLDIIRVIDFSTAEYTSTLDTQKLKQKITQLCDKYEKATYCLLHVIGTLSTDEQRCIIENLRTTVPSAEIKTVTTEKEVLGKAVIEGVFFGPFA